METNYSRQRLTLEGRQANWEVCFRTHTTLVKANTAPHTKSDQSDTATTQQPMITREHALTGLHHQVTSPPSRIAQCLLIQTKGDKENMKHQSTPAVGQTHIYTGTKGKIDSPCTGY